jgi:hypothetical protein
LRRFKRLAREVPRLNPFGTTIFLPTLMLEDAQVSVALDFPKATSQVTVVTVVPKTSSLHHP